MFTSVSVIHRSKFTKTCYSERESQFSLSDCPIITEHLLSLSEMFVSAAFYVIETEDHQKVRMTSGHFIPVLTTNGCRHYVPVQTLTTNDYVFIRKSEKNKELKPSKVANITIEVKVGYYSILTRSGK